MILKIFNQSDKDKIKSYIDKLPDKPYSVRFEIIRPQRSIKQNALYQMWLNCLMADSGWHRDDIHDELGKRFLPKTTRAYRDEEKEIPISTSELNTKEFTDYLNRVQQFAAIEFGCVLPLPEDQIWEDFANQYQKYI